MSRGDGTIEMLGAARRLFTREEYHRMGEVGILKPTDRVELIRDEIVEMISFRDAPRTGGIA